MFARRLSLGLAIALVLSCSSRQATTPTPVSSNFDFSIYMENPLAELRDIVDQPHIAPLLKERYQVVNSTLREWQDASADWPQQAVLSAGPGASRFSGEIFGLLFAYYQATETGTFVGYKVRQKIIASLSELKVPEFALRLRYDTEPAAASGFASVVRGTNDVDKQILEPGSRSDKRIAFRFVVGEYMSQAEIAAGLVDIGLVEKADGDALEISRHLIALKFRLVVTWDGNELVFRLGEVASLETPPIASIRDAARGEKRAFLSMSWSIEPMLTSFQSWYEALRDFERPSTALDEMEFAIRGAGYLGPRGTARAWVDNGFHWQAVTEGAETMAPLRDTPMAKMVGPDSAYYMSTATSIEAILANILSRIESRLVSRVDELEETYYQKFGELRASVYQAAAKREPYPLAIIVSSKGEVRSLSDGQNVTKVEIGLPELAVIAGPPAPLKLIDFVDETFVSTLRDGFGIKATPSSFAKLGLGRSSRIYDGAWLRALIPDAASADFDADFAPHLTHDEEIVVFSSSFRLSKELLKRSSKPTPWRLHPNASTAFQFTRAHVTAYLDMLEGWATFSGTDASSELADFRLAVSILDALRAEVVHKDGLETTTFSISLRPPSE